MSSTPREPTQWWDKLVVSLSFADLNDRATRDRLDSAAAKANNQGIHLAASWQYGRALPMLTAAVEVWTRLEQVSGAINVRNARGHVYRKIGAFDAAHDDHREALLLARESALSAGESAARTGLALVAVAVDELDHAEHLCREAIQQSDATDDGAGAAHAAHALGRVFEARKAWDDAHDAYETARTRWEALSAPVEQLEALAGSARTLLARGHMLDAAAHAEHILAHLAQHGPARLNEPLLLYWTLYRVLHTLRDEDNAHEVLRAANMLMMRQMEGLDPEARERFRRAVPLHRDIAETWLKVLTAQEDTGDDAEEW